MRIPAQTIHMIRMRLNKEMEPHVVHLLKSEPAEIAADDNFIDTYSALCARWLRSTRYWAKVADHPGTPRQRRKK